jgi:hypothetical protein
VSGIYGPEVTQVETYNALAPETVLPVQLERRFGSGCGSPEKRLMAAVLIDALRILAKGHGGIAGDSRRGRLQEARAWLMDDDAEWPFAFRPICETLGINPDAVRRVDFKGLRLPNNIVRPSGVAAPAPEIGPVAGRDPLVCLACGEVFIPTAAQQRYCGECKARVTASVRKPAGSPPSGKDVRLCKHQGCDAVFAPVHARNVYCATHRPLPKIPLDALLQRALGREA